MKPNKSYIGLWTIFAVLNVTLFVASAWAAPRVRVLYNFKKPQRGRRPLTTLIRDSSGNLYGTALAGGPRGRGVVFELTPGTGGRWTQKVLHSFPSHSGDGQRPIGSLALDASRNLYGTTYGADSSAGTVFELTPASHGWTEKTLYKFNPGQDHDGANPAAGLVLDATGNLYGTTVLGGTDNVGTVFELSPQAGGSWTETRLHYFRNDGTDGCYPYGGLIFDAAGNLYGTTTQCSAGGGGSVFELSPKAGGGWTEQTLYAFKNPIGSLASLVFDNSGNLYGTDTGDGPKGYGSVFELSPADGGWTGQTLYKFSCGSDGCFPTAVLIFDAAGNLYSTTTQGGSRNRGTVFELSPKAGGGWTERVVHRFQYIPACQCSDGFDIHGGLVFDAAGKTLYGTASAGGKGYGGTVFEIIP